MLHENCARACMGYSKFELKIATMAPVVPCGDKEGNETSGLGEGAAGDLLLLHFARIETAAAV